MQWYFQSSMHPIWRLWHSLPHVAQRRNLAQSFTSLSRHRQPHSLGRRRRLSRSNFKMMVLLKFRCLRRHLRLRLCLCVLVCRRDQDLTGTKTRSSFWSRLSIMRIHSSSRGSRQRLRRGTRYTLRFRRTLRQKRLPHRDLASMKTKWTQLSNARKAHNQTARGASGVVEHTSDFQRMINDVVQSDLGNMHLRPSAATADAHRSMLATLSCEPHVSAAGRSMQPMSQRRVSSTSESDASETSVILNNAENDTGVAVEGPQVSRKRGRIALAETLDAMIEADRVHRKGADDMRSETLKIKKAHLDLQKVSLEVQKGMVETGRTFITQMSSDLTTVKNDMESLKTLVQSTMEQQKQAINSLLDMMRGLVSQGSGASVIPLEAAVPSAPSTTVPSQPMHPITEEPTTPQAQRCVSVESTTNATPTRNSPLSEVSRLRSPESV